MHPPAHNAGLAWALANKALQEEERARRDRTYKDDLRRVLDVRAGQYPEYHVVICFHSAATITWSKDSRWLEVRREQELAPEKYGWADSWYSVLYVVLEGQLQYSHPGMGSKE